MSREAEQFAAAVFAMLATSVVGTIAVLACGLILQLGWNWSMPQLFALPEASYRNAVGLSLLVWVVKVNVSVTKEG